MQSLYYFERDGQPAGPVPASQLVAQGVRSATRVWCAGMSEWLPAASVADQWSFFPQTPPPLPKRAAESSPVTDTTQPPALHVAIASVSPLLSPRLVTGQHTATLPTPPTVPPLPLHPHFTAPANTRVWWHYLLYAIAVFVILLFARACGVIIGKLISATWQTKENSAWVWTCRIPAKPVGSLSAMAGIGCSQVAVMN